MDPTARPLLPPAPLPAPSSRPGKQSRLVLVRHGKPEIEKGISSTQWPLSQSGRDAAASALQKSPDLSHRERIPVV
jgi:hypothetical protein